MALEPPTSRRTSPARALDDDYLVLSTIHFGQGWSGMPSTLIHAATAISIRHGNQGYRRRGRERRLFYVALTRPELALRALAVAVLHSYRPQASDHYGMAQRTRFLPSRSENFDRQITTGMGGQEDAPAVAFNFGLTSKTIRGR